MSDEPRAKARPPEPEPVGSPHGEVDPPGISPEARRGMERFRFTTTRPVAVLMVFCAVMVFGAFSLRLLPVNLMPEISYPKLTVRTEYPGAAPAEVENDVARPLEEVLGVVTGVTRLSSVSTAGNCDVVMEFAWDTDMDDANQDVLEKLDAIRPQLPDDVKAPLILRYDPTLDPVLVLSLSGDGETFEGVDGLKYLRRIADREVKRILEPLDGVAAVKIKGGLEEEIHVDIDEDALRRTNVAISAVTQRLQAENINLAGGSMREGRTRYLIRTVNEFESLEDLRDTVIEVRDGREIRLRDLAEVTSAYKDREVITRVGGDEAIEIEIYKEADANIVDMARKVRDRLGAPTTLTPDPGGLGEGDTDGAGGDTDGEAGGDTDGEASGEAGDETTGAGAKRGPPRAGPSRGPLPLIQAIEQDHGATLTVVSDRSLFIKSSINEVLNTAIVGGLLAIAVLYLFLRNARATAIVAVAIPMSVVITFAPMSLADVSLNVMSLGGMALGIGMLVDNSIVVLESIHRCREEGDDLIRGTIRGTAEVGSAVVASTLTSIAVFFPMVFVEGVAGQMFGALGLTVVFSLLASLAVALFFIPMLVSRNLVGEEHLRSFSGGMKSLWGKWACVEGFRRWRAETRRFWLGLPWALFRFVVHGFFELLFGKLLATFVLLVAWVVLTPVRREGKLLNYVIGPVLAGFDWIIRGLSRLYIGVIGWALRNAVIVVGLAVACMVGVVSMARGLDTELIPEVHQGELTLELTYPVGTPIVETDEQVAPVEAQLQQEVPRLRSLVTSVGSEKEDADDGDKGEHTASLKMILDTGRTGGGAVEGGAPLTPELAEREALDVVREQLSTVPDVTYSVTRPVLFSFKTPVEVEVRGFELEELADATKAVEEALADVDGLADVTSSIRPGNPEVQIVYDRDALARLGLDIRTVAELVRDKVQGAEATKYRRRDRKIPVLVRLEDVEQVGVADLEELVVNPGGARPIPLSAVAEVRLGRGPNEIRRIGQQRVGVVTANIDGIGLGTADVRIEEALRGVKLPGSVTTEITGQSEEWETSSRSLYLALGLSVFLVYVIMASQFESLIYPLIILVTIPLALVGVVLALHLLGLPVSVVVFLGVIMLAGIVVNNAIVLVDYVNQLKARGHQTDEALVLAGEVRLRPILMTTLTTVLGLIPMAMGLGDGAEIRQPMAITVIAGLSLSTVLTLVVIPTLYHLVDRVTVRNRQKPGDALEAELAELDHDLLAPEDLRGEAAEDAEAPSEEDAP